MGSRRSTYKVCTLSAHPNELLDRKVAQIYLREIVRIHGLPETIISDRDPRFLSRFWVSLSKALGTKLHPSTAAHLQTDGQSERTIQILEDMLRTCVLDSGVTGKSMYH